MFVGSLLIIIGAVFLLKNLGILTAGAWGILWPLFLVVLGAYLIFKHFQWQQVKSKIWRRYLDEDY